MSEVIKNRYEFVVLFDVEKEGDELVITVMDREYRL